MDDIKKILIWELIMTDKTIARVCEEHDVRPTDYPSLFRLTERIENIKKAAAEEILEMAETCVSVEQLKMKLKKKFGIGSEKDEYKKNSSLV